MIPFVSSSQEIFGQNLFCVSLPQSKLFKLAGLMTLNMPCVYEHRIQYPNSNITSLIDKHSPYPALETASYQFSEHNKDFVYFAKSGTFNKNIWENLIAPELQDNLWVESWGRPYEDSFCNPEYLYSVLNIREITFSSYSWKDTQDHSKWALTTTKDLVCYGDMNMMTSQDHRGGGAICLSDPTFHGFSLKLVTRVDDCKDTLNKELVS